MQSSIFYFFGSWLVYAANSSSSSTQPLMPQAEPDISSGSSIDLNNHHVQLYHIRQTTEQNTK